MKAVLTLALGHASADFYPGYLPSVLPYLIAKLGFSLTVAGGLASLQSFATSLIQPLLGYLVDARRPRPYAAWGLVGATVLFSLMGLAPNGWLLAGLIVLGGFGVALYHPQGAAMAAMLSGGRAGTAMSLFATGGSIGHALGPLVAVLVVEAWGLESLVVLSVPGLVVAWLVHRAMRVPLAEMESRRRHVSLRAALAGAGSQLVLLLAVMTLRSAASVGISTMLPIYLEAKGLALAIGATAIFVFRLAGAVGVFFGGPLSDRFGRREVIWVSFALALPFLYLFFNSDGAMRLLHLALAAAVLTSSTPVNTVMAQETIPRTAAVASGLMMGVGWALGSLAVFVIGFLADRVGIEAALPATTMVLVVAGLVLALLVPRRPRTAP
ncbi:MAG: MFS transporter [Anaerolineae bacterium]|nr:MFS transporter [Anaerolineae bacterium]